MLRMAHIVIGCPSSNSGSSVANVAIKHARELAKYFERVTLVSDSFPDKLPENVGRGLVTPIKFNFLRRLCHVPNEYAFVRSVRNHLATLHKKNPIDMIICHSHALAALSAKPLKERYGIPFALVTHGDIFDRPKGTYDSRLTAFYKAITPVAYRNADVIIALSPYMAACAQKGGANSNIIHIVPNGIDPTDIGLNGSENISGLLERKQTTAIRLLYAGRLSIEKGIDTLIKACGILNKKNVNFTLEIIGDGPMEKSLRRMVEMSRLSNRITFLGKVDRRMLGSYYRRSDLVCVPSISDPLPTVVLEALISSTPVVGSDTGGIPFMVSNGRTGWIVPHGDPNALAGVVEDVSKNPAVLRLLGNAAFREASERFNWGNIGRQLSEIIARAITEDANPRP
jgi:glycosyltransferase involved in cell wall biosynthesis